MTLNEYVIGKIEELFDGMVVSIYAKGVVFDDFTEDEYPAIATALMLNAMPAVMQVSSTSLDQACNQ